MCVLRFLLLRLTYRGKLSVKRLSMVGRRCGVYLQGKGTLHCSGRMILNDDVMIQSKGKLTFGDNLGVNSYSRIIAHEAIEIGDDVTIGQMVSILDHDHHYELKGEKLELDGYDTAPVRIGNNVWIGDKSTVLKGVKIGNNVIVGAHTLVNKDVPDNCVIGGSPFKILKRF